MGERRGGGSGRLGRVLSSGCPWNVNSRQGDALLSHAGKFGCAGLGCGGGLRGWSYVREARGDVVVHTGGGATAASALGGDDMS